MNSGPKVTQSFSITDLSRNCVESKNRKRIREHVRNDQVRVKRAKVYNGFDPLSDLSLLHLFVEYAWEASYDKFSMANTVQLVNWMCSENIDVKSNVWYSPESMSIWESKDQATLAKLAYTLRFILPTLVTCNGHAKYVDKYGQTILHVFLKHYMRNPQSHVETDIKLNKIVVALIAKGVLLNQTDKFGDTPFSIAVIKLRRDLCLLMLPYFTNVSACDDNGNTVLHIISGNRSQPNVWCEIVGALLTKGAVLNKRNNDGFTPVHLAAKSGKDRILQVFTKHDVDFSLRTTKGETSLLLYCRNQRKIELSVQTVLLLLTDDCDVDAADEFGFSAVHYAIRQGANAVVERLSKFRTQKCSYAGDI